MRWFRSTSSVYYGGSGSHSTYAENVVVGPYVYNDKVYGTEEKPMFKVAWVASILSPDHYICPVEGARIDYAYHRVVGVTDDRDLSKASWEEIPAAEISGKYKFHKNLAGRIYSGFSIPCNFIISFENGECFTGNYIKANGTSSSSPSITYCGLRWGNILTEELITFGSVSDAYDATSAELPAEHQNCVVDFGTINQNIPLFILEWIESNATKIVEDSAAMQIPMVSPNGVRLKTEDKYCDRDIEVIPVLQEKTAVDNGEVIPDDGYNGLSKVIVNVETGGSTDLSPIVKSLETLGVDVESADVDSLAAAVADLDSWINPWETIPREGTDLIGDYQVMETRYDGNGIFKFSSYLRLKKSANISFIAPNMEQYGGIDLTELHDAVDYIYNNSVYESNTIKIFGITFSRCILPDIYPCYKTSKSPVNLFPYAPAAIYLSRKISEASQEKVVPSTWITHISTALTVERIVKCPKDTEIPYYLNKFSNISVESMVGIFENMIDRSGETTVATITLGTDNLAKLTEEQKNIAYTKGWTLA